VTLEQQFLSLFVMLGSSILIGILFDSYRVLKGIGEFSAWIVFIIDVIFGIFAALFVFRLLLWSNHGQLRLVMLIAFFVGLWMYFKGFSTHMVTFWLAFFHLIYRIWRMIVISIQFVLIKPVKFIYTFLVTVIGFFMSVLLTVFRSLFRMLNAISTKLFSKSKNAGNNLILKIKAGFFSLFKKIIKRK